MLRRDSSYSSQSWHQSWALFFAESISLKHRIYIKLLWNVTDVVWSIFKL